MLSQDPPIKIHSMTPQEFHDLLKNNGLVVEKIVCKIATMPLRFTPQFIMKTNNPEEILSDILQLEVEFSEQPDAAALGGHLQAIARKE